MKKPLGILGAMMVSGALAGCLPQPMVSDIRLHTNMLIPSHFAYAAREGKVEVVFKGHLLGATPEAFAAQATRAMEHAHAGPQTQFVARPAGSQEIYRLVYLVDPDPLTLARKACENTETVTTRPQGGPTTRMMGVFCQRETPLSEAVAAMDGVISVDSPAFSGLVTGLTLAILPHSTPDGAEWDTR